MEFGSLFPTRFFPPDMLDDSFSNGIVLLGKKISLFNLKENKYLKIRKHKYILLNKYTNQ